MNITRIHTARRRTARGTALIVSALLLVLVVSGCGFIGDSSLGTIVLSLSPRLTTRTIEPDLDMSSAYYDVYGTGPGGATFQQLAVTGTTVVQSSLVPGEWSLLVEAYNADVPPTLIGSGVLAVTVSAGEVLPATITIVPIAGSGTLSVDFTWPAGVLTTPVFDATLTPVGGSPSALTVPVSGEAAAYSDAHPTGYYLLTATLLDEGATVWGTAEAVRIIDGRTSYRLFELQEAVNRGGLDLTVVEALDNPIEITLDRADGVQIPLGGTLTVTATTSEPVDSYAWYVQGQLQGDTGAAIDLTPTELGYYWLNLVVTAGDVLGSETLEYQVIAAP